MFYQIEKNKWHSGFYLASNFSREYLERMVNSHLHRGWVTAYEKGYRLTEIGQTAYREYFKTHYYPKEIQSFTYAMIRTPFWNRLQLYSQVFSEMSYQNNTYVPVIKHPHHQENVRHLFQQVGPNKKGLFTQWVKEQTYLFHQMDEQRANVLANLLTGHDQVGKTKEQIRMSLQMEPLEFYFYLMDTLEVLLQTIHAQKKKVPLTSAILTTLLIERNLGLSASTKQTYDLLKSKKTFEQIAQLRNIKVNTVREHILEMAFVFDHFPFETFVPQEIMRQLNKQFDKNPEYSYKEAVSDFDSIEFMHFRLVELERMRRNNENNRTSPQ